MSEEAGPAPEPPPRAPAGRGPRRTAWPLAFLLLAALLGAVVWLVLGRDSGPVATEREPLATTTATVVRADLTETETLEGTLGYADEMAVQAQAAGTVTALAREGSVVERGRALFRIDAAPVVLLYGSVPAYRALERGVPEGPDVRQLERNLRALGFDPDRELVVDEEFDAATQDAVERWQEKLGLDADGVVPLGRVVFLPGRVRVGAHQVDVGSAVSPGVPVLDVASTDQVVSVELPVDRRSLVSVGGRVQVELPSGDTVSGRVTAIGTVATAAPRADGATGEATVEVRIVLDRAAQIDLDEAPVDVEIVTESRTGVLAVPVTALLALAGGGYAVELQEAGGSRLVAVEPGLYADGLVEVEGNGLSEGATVVVPA